MKNFFVKVSDVINSIDKIDWVVGGYLEAGSISSIVGKKSMNEEKLKVAVSQAVAVATGSEWNGNKAKKGAVVFVSGASGNKPLEMINDCVIEKGHDIDDVNVFFAPSNRFLFCESFERAIERGLNSICAKIGDVSLVVIESSAFCFVGDAELINTARFIVDFYGCHVVIVDDADMGRLGSGGETLLHAAVDDEFLISHDGSSASYKNTKSRDHQDVKTVFLS